MQGNVARRIWNAVEAAGEDAGAIIVLAGETPAVTTAACAGVLAGLPASWHRIWRPRAVGDLIAGLTGPGPDAPAPWTVVWLDPIERYLRPDDPARAEEAAAGLRELLADARRRPVLVMATARSGPEGWGALVRVPASGRADPLTQTRALLNGAQLMVVDSGREVPRIVSEGLAPITAAWLPTLPHDQGRHGDREVRPRNLDEVLDHDRLLDHGGREPGRAPAEVGEIAEIVETPGVTEPAEDSVVVASIEGLSPAGAIEQFAPAEAIAESGGAAPVTHTPEPPAIEVPPVVAPTPRDQGLPRDQGISRDQGVRHDRELELGDHDEAVDRGQEPAVAVAPVIEALVDLSLAPAPSPPRAPMSLPELFRRAEQREGLGNAAGAERLYEAGAIGGDLVALAKLAQLRGLLGPTRGTDDAAQARRLFEQASAEGNTGTLFCLAAAGDEDALSALRRMRDRSAAPPIVERSEPEDAARAAAVPTAGPDRRNRRAASKPRIQVRRAPSRKARRRKR